MSERWQFQIKNGGIWGFIISLCIAIIDLFEISFEDAFLSQEKLLRTLYFVLAGIFIVGYSTWKKKIKRERTPELPHDNPINE
ncbi:hypothetical protein SAMN05444395_101618 [Flavobacterium fryxellicola]|uniref:Uncharacterized protein n=1 Tax=Flavobacterium fryxellicola TaxID=249352 RepID=A0A168AEV6_9FLAO|nr:hypothetical protein [Flavobacterium fryxellicola]OAB31406.1 hypothetical protein FBFR_00800 [Flavobacterium fryxellicola]SHN54119.1 hypothetical protein SAMN05444395_101618 [Flavobacterium fryxellicola]